MTLDERLEAAARALCGKFWSELDWRELSPKAKEVYRDAGRAALAAAYPELSAGTHWLAPMEATDAMARAFLSIKSSVPDDPRAGPTMAQAWRAARDAYLKEGGK